jgi:hypothetical protein
MTKRLVNPASLYDGSPLGLSQGTIDEDSIYVRGELEDHMDGLAPILSSFLGESRTAITGMVFPLLPLELRLWKSKQSLACDEHNSDQNPDPPVGFGVSDAQFVTARAHNGHRRRAGHRKRLPLLE